MNGETEPTRPCRAVWYFAVAGLLASVTVAALLYLRMLPTGVPGQWEWPWRDVGHACRPLLVLIPLLYLLLALVVHAASRRERIRGSRVVLCLLLACVTVGGTMVALLADEDAPPLHLVSAMASASAMGYLSYATAFDDPWELLGTYTADSPRAGTMPGRVRTHPPGPALFCYVGLRALDRLPGLRVAIERWLSSRYGLTPALMWEYSRWYVMPTVKPPHLIAALVLGLLVTLLGSLLPVPAYFIGAALADRRTGLLAAFAAALIPSLVLFIPTIDAFAAVLALTPVALWLWAVRKHNLWLHAACGLAMAAAVFWSVGLAAVAVCMAITVAPGWRDREQRRRLVDGALIALGAFAAIYVLLALLGLYGLPTGLRIIFAEQRRQMEYAHRSYLTWLPMNLWEVVLFMGPALLALVAGSLACVRRFPSGLRAYAVGAVLTLVLVWLSGSTLGEVGRIWLFLMALLAPVVAASLATFAPKQRLAVLVLLALVQVQAIVLLHCNLLLMHA
jgi:hypothetical protein